MKGRINMITVSPDEFRKNQEKYLRLATSEEVQIIKDGKLLFSVYSMHPSQMNRIEEELRETGQD